MANDGKSYHRAGGTAEFRQSTKLAFGLRDHMMCLACQIDLTTLAPIDVQLDHLITFFQYWNEMTDEDRAEFGSLNRSENVVSICGPCNKSRGKKAWRDFYSLEAQARVELQVTLPMPRALALAYLKGKTG